MASFRHTKIVATLGPASAKPEVVLSLITAGVNVFRLNFSHGDLKEKEEQIAMVRQATRDLERPIALMQDLQGPKMRVGRLVDGSVHLIEGSHVVITPDEGQEGTATSLSVSYPRLAVVVRAGDSIFLDDGLLELKVLHANGSVVEAEVLKGGALTDHKGVNLPGVDLDLPPLTEKDQIDLRFALRHDIDLVAMSFVRSAKDALSARTIMAECGKPVPLIAKIEKREALAELQPILRTFDGVMVARGDLGVELAPEKVPAAQKAIIRRARSLGKPVITATQMLESMTHSPRPTRAEASDVANAVLDGTDAVMLSAETAVGQYPVQTVQAMDRIIREAEGIHTQDERVAIESDSDTEAVCAAAVHLAEELSAAALTALTRSGHTAKILSAYRPSVPILAFLVNNEGLARQLTLWRGVWPMVVERALDPSDTMLVIENELRERRLVDRGSKVVVVGAAPGTPAGRTNFIRLLRI